MVHLNRLIACIFGQMDVFTEPSQHVESFQQSACLWASPTPKMYPKRVVLSCALTTVAEPVRQKRSEQNGATPIIVEMLMFFCCFSELHILT